MPERSNQWWISALLLITQKIKLLNSQTPCARCSCWKQIGTLALKSPCATSTDRHLRPQARLASVPVASAKAPVAGPGEASNGKASLGPCSGEASNGRVGFGPCSGGWWQTAICVRRQGLSENFSNSLEPVRGWRVGRGCEIPLYSLPLHTACSLNYVIHSI